MADQETASKLLATYTPSTPTAKRSRSKLNTALAGPHGYETFMAKRPVQAYPADAVTIAAWFTDSIPGVMYDTISSYLGAVVRVHNEHAWPCTWTTIPHEITFLADIRSKLRNEFGRSAPAVKQAVTPELLHLLSLNLDLTSHDNRVCYAACCLATYNSLRGCEFLYSTKYPEKSLLRERWIFTAQGGRLQLFDTKTKKDAVVTVDVACLPPPDPTCPVEALRSMVDKCPFHLPPKQPLFTLEDGSWLTLPILTAWVLDLFEADGFLGSSALTPGARILATSWRAGGATGGVRANLAAKTINYIGHWAANSLHAIMTYSQVGHREATAGRAAMSAAGKAAAQQLVAAEARAT